MTETFVVTTHLDDDHNWTRIRTATSRIEVVRMMDESRAGRPIEEVLRRRIAAFLDGLPPEAWSTSKHPIHHLQCMGPGWTDAYGHAYLVTG